MTDLPRHDDRSEHEGRGGSRSVPALLPFTIGDTVIVRDVLESMVDAVLGASPERPPVDVEIDVPPAVVVSVDAAALGRVLAPLLERAVDAARRCARPGRRRPEVVVTGVRGTDSLEIEFADSGPGLEPAEIATLARGRPRTGPQGSDARLADVVRRAAALGASVTAVDCPDGGSAVTLLFPRRRESLRRAA